MARVILHIGQSKTGTTAVQRFLARERATFRRYGVLYPDIQKGGRGQGAGDHNLVAWSLVDKLSPLAKPFEVFWEDIARHLKVESDIHTVLLSAEGFFGEPHPWAFDSIAEWRLANEKKIQRLQSALREHHVTIIAYFRRQDLWVDSAFKHTVKVQRLIGKQLYDTPEKFTRALKERLDYASEMSLWQRYFPEAEIIVRPYEQQKLYREDAVADFLSVLGLDKLDFQKFPVATANHRNVGLPRDVLEFKKILNRLQFSKARERVLIAALEEIAGDFTSKHSAWDNVLSPTERSAMVEEYSESNERLKQWARSSVRSDVPFFEPIASGAEMEPAYPGLTAQRALEVGMRLERVLCTRQSKMLYAKYRLGEIARAKFGRLYPFVVPIVKRIIRRGQGSQQ